MKREPGRLALLTICAGLIAGVYLLLLGVAFVVFVNAVGCSENLFLLWVCILAEPLAWLVIVPLMAGYTNALLLLLWDRRPPVRYLWSWADSPGRYFHVLLAGCIPLFPGWLVSVPVCFFPPADGFRLGLELELPLRLGLYLVLLPFAFAAISALAARERFPKALGHSFVLTLRNWRLSVILLPMHLWLLALQLGYTLRIPIIFMIWIIMFGFYPEKSGAGIASLPFLFLFGFIAAGVILASSQVAVALLFQELVWREREAAAPAAAPPSESA
ncbi:MAG: hypothetical protein NT049_19165 [Planctomycetota bacterium]|nr:hypothetical protein [Planctomycetota bacterium]